MIYSALEILSMRIIWVRSRMAGANAPVVLAVIEPDGLSGALRVLTENRTPPALPSNLCYGCAKICLLELVTESGGGDRAEGERRGREYERRMKHS